MSHDWVLPGIAPLLLPWLAILALLTLKPNRCGAAWLIWLPLALPLALIAAPLPMLPSGTSFLVDAVVALAAALGAVWLLSNYLARQRWFFTFLLVLLALTGFSALGLVSQPGWSFGIEIVQSGIVLTMGVLVSALAVALTGLVCRGRYHPFGLYAWLFLWLTVLWTAIAFPILAMFSRRPGGNMMWSEFMALVLMAAIINFAALLAFLILLSASPFYRERLEALLHVKPETRPVMAPLPELSLKA